jgi:hypothetical protein
MILVTDLSQALTYSGSTALHTLGSVYFEDTSGKVYRYIRAAAACIDDLLAIGQPICADTDGDWYGNNDLAGGTGFGTVPLGVPQVTARH